MEYTIKDALAELRLVADNMRLNVVQSRGLWGYYFGRIEGFIALYRLIGRYMNSEDQNEYMKILEQCRDTLRKYEG